LNKKEYRITFLLADVVVITALHQLEQKLRRDKKLREETNAKKRDEIHEMDKKSSKGRQARARADHVVPTDKQAKVTKHSKPSPIQQPSKTGKKGN